MSKKGYRDSPHAKAGILIREGLKDRFPHIKFKVSSEFYPSGSIINISWLDGPSKDLVEPIVAPYRISNPVLGKEEIPHASYIFLNRNCYAY